MPLLPSSPATHIKTELGSQEVRFPSQFGFYPGTHHLSVYPAWETDDYPHTEVRVYAVYDCEVGGGGFIRQAEAVIMPDGCFPVWLKPVLIGEWPEVEKWWLGAFFDEDAPVIELSSPCATIVNPNMVYGHFLLEMLPRLHLLGVLRSLGREFSILVPRNAPAWLLRFVLLYVDKEEVIWYDSARERVRAPLLVVPTMMHASDHYSLHPAMSLMVDDLKARAGVPAHNAAASRRLYLSRRRLESPGWHRLLNEADVEDVFEELGFEILHPQDMTIHDQLVAYSEAAVLGGEFSSAMHNALFCRRGVKVFVINETNDMQARIARLRNQRLAVMPPDDGMFRLWQTHADDGEYTVDVVALRASLGEFLLD